jgi:hypothetical protein
MPNRVNIITNEGQYTKYKADLDGNWMLAWQKLGRKMGGVLCTRGETDFDPSCTDKDDLGFLSITTNGINGWTDMNMH